MLCRGNTVDFSLSDSSADWEHAPQFDFTQLHIILSTFAVWMDNLCKWTKTCGNTSSNKPTKTAALKTDTVTYFPPKL